MESTITTSSKGNTWELVPTNSTAGIVLTILLLYLFIRHFLFVLMLMDITIGWLRKFNWFPKEGKRLKAFIHWIIALGLFIGFLVLSNSIGWMEMIPQ